MNFNFPAVEICMTNWHAYSNYQQARHAKTAWIFFLVSNKRMTTGQKLNEGPVFSSPHWFVIHVDHRTMKRNLSKEDLGKTRLRSWRAGACQRVSRGELVRRKNIRKSCPPEGSPLVKEESCCYNVEVEHQLCLPHLKPCYVVFIIGVDDRSAMCCSFILNLDNCSCNWSSRLKRP